MSQPGQRTGSSGSCAQSVTERFESTLAASKDKVSMFRPFERVSAGKLKIAIPDAVVYARYIHISAFVVYLQVSRYSAHLVPRY